jgi:uncharacterized protein
MDSQERDVIAGIFKRLEAAATQPRDPEAEKFIAEKLQNQPYAPYAMAQSIYVQEQALTNLNAQVEQMQQEIMRLQNQPRSGGFLSGLFGGAPQRPQAPSSFGQSSFNQAARPQNYGQAQQQPSGPSGPWGAPAPAAGGGFLQGAMKTAVGVAGGMMIANALTNAFSGAGEAAASAASAATDQVASAAESFTGYDQQPEPEPASYDDGGGDFGGGDEWA